MHLRLFDYTCHACILTMEIGYGDSVSPPRRGYYYHLGEILPTSFGQGKYIQSISQRNSVLRRG